MEALTAALSTAAGRADPYPYYARLHELGEAIRPAPGVVIVVGYDASDCARAALANVQAARRTIIDRRRMKWLPVITVMPGFMLLHAGRPTVVTFAGSLKT